jgi:hypothetical protein
MSDSKSTDHWNVLARLLGAAPAVEPEEEPRASESPLPAEVAEAEQPEKQAAEPEATTEIAACIEPAEVEVRIAAKPAPEAAPPRISPPKPKPVNHWRELANALGIEVTEPEPEPEPEPVEDVAEIDIPTRTPPPAPAPRLPERTERMHLGPRTADQEPARPPERTERAVDTGARGRSESRRGHRRASLFEDPDLSLDTPGVLDAIFDEVEPEMPAESEPVADRRPADIREDGRERTEKFVPRELDLEFSDDAAEEKVEEVAADRNEPRAPRDTDEEDRQGRRRKRRRRRGGRRDQKPTSEGIQVDAGDEGLEEDENEEAVESRSDATDIRERRAIADTKERDDLEEEKERDELDDAGERDELDDDGERDELDDDEEEDQFADEDDEEGASERLKLKHKKIPTWQQAIDSILAVNMDSRAKNPGGGGGRGRGRRWRK